MSDELISEINTDEVQEADNQAKDPKELSLEALILLLNLERLKQLENESFTELSNLKKRQDQVAELHKVMKAINNATGSKGELDITNNEELKTLISKAKELGANIDEKKLTYSKDERDRLIENIRMTVDDLNVQNDMGLQSVTRLTNERYESYQMAKSLMRPLHEVKINSARGITGR